MLYSMLIRRFHPQKYCKQIVLKFDYMQIENK